MPEDEGLPPPAAEIVNRLRQAHTDERSRLARELHDQVAHALGVALSSLELHQLYLQSDLPRAQAQLRSAVSAVRTSLEMVSALCSDLRRREVVDGLEAALRDYLGTVAPPAIRWAVRVTGDDSALPVELRDELFLTLREAARNSLIHSSARHIGIVVRIAPDAVRATVYDDGIGFDVSQHGRTGGLASMRERVQLLGGSITLASVPGTGTTVQVHIPLAGTADE
jgi:signal transduction histidine kinase